MKFYRGCFQIILFVCVVFLFKGLADGQESKISAGTPETNPGRMVVTLWDVGGGNFFTPVAKISVDVFGTDASQIKLFSISFKGAMTELQSSTCKDGSKINFNTKYNRGETETLEIHLYDSKGNLMTSAKRKVN